MKSDFTFAKEELRRIGIIRVSTDFYSGPKKKGSCYFVKSPATHDKTASLALYPNSNRFCDFANGGASGDCIAFVAYVKGCNQWEALKELQAFYGLTDSREQDKREIQQQIQMQKEAQQKKQERFYEFYVALQAEIDRLRDWKQICQRALIEGVYEPLSEMQAYLINESQKAEYKLNILCAIDCEAYRRMKSNADKGLPSDAPQWILDVCEILREDGIFRVTQEELKELQAQRDFELVRRPGKDRVYKIDWADRIWRSGSGGEGDGTSSIR